jgi:hypothetical protein
MSTCAIRCAARSISLARSGGASLGRGGGVRVARGRAHACPDLDRPGGARGRLVFLAVLAERFFGFELGRRQWIGIALVAVSLKLRGIATGLGFGISDVAIKALSGDLEQRAGRPPQPLERRHRHGGGRRAVPGRQAPAAGGRRLLAPLGGRAVHRHAAGCLSGAHGPRHQSRTARPARRGVLPRVAAGAARANDARRRTRAAWTPSRCSARERAPTTPALTSTMPTRPLWRRSAGASMAYRWPSSWRRRAAGCCHPARSPSACRRRSVRARPRSRRPAQAPHGAGGDRSPCTCRCPRRARADPPG